MQLEQELIRFHRFIATRLQVGDQTMTPEEALDLWRSENPSPDDYAETVAALKESFADFDAGDRGMPLEQFDREFRRSNQMDPPAA